jgi:hypothetical protein
VIRLILQQIGTMALTASVMLANLQYGWDRHIWDVKIDKLAGKFHFQNDSSVFANNSKAALQIAFSSKILYSAASGFTRLSLLCFYYRLVKESRLKWFRYMTHFSRESSDPLSKQENLQFVVVFTVATMIGLIFLTIFQCRFALQASATKFSHLTMI